jgi:hypothetical protein
MRIHSYAFGKIVVDGKLFTQDLILLPGKIEAPWNRQIGHYLQKTDLESILDLPVKPERLILGTGYEGRLEVPAQLKEELSGQGIQVLVMDTPNAVRFYNECPSEKTVAALHLTC